MKTILQTIFLLLIAFNLKAQVDTVITFNDAGMPQDTAFFDCLAFIGEFEAPTAATAGFCASADDASLLMPTFINGSNPDFNFDFIVTIDSDPNIDQYNEEVVAVTSDGFVDFTNFAPATYCFTAISYKQSELDIITNDPSIKSLIPSYCLLGNESLEEVVFCIKENFDLANIESVTDSILADVVTNVVPEFESEYDENTGVSTFNAPFCFDITPNGQEYCIEVLGTDNNCYVGINDVYKNEIALNNLPNPFAQKTTVTFNLTNAQQVQFQIFDMAGKVILNKQFLANTGENNLNINAKNLKNGIYYYSIKSDDKIALNKMVVSK